MSDGSHSLGGGSASARVDAAQADLNGFPTSNVYDGGCATCGCQIPIVLEYENGDPVPDAEFVVKFGEQRESDEGLIEVVPVNDAQRSAPEIKGVVDENGLAHVKNAICSTYVILFGEGSDALDPPRLDEQSELYIAIEQASASAGAGSLSPRGRGQLLWWLSAWLKQKRTEHMIHRIENGEVSSTAEVTELVTEYGAPLWTSENGAVNEDARSRILSEASIASVEDSAYNSWNPFVDGDGALVNLLEKLEDRQDELEDKLDEPGARQTARSLKQILTDGNEIPNARFYQVLSTLGQAERAAARLFDPNEAGAWDVFMLVAEAVLGFIPIVGDIIDVVDIVKWFYKFSDENENAGTWDYVELGALSLGFIPAIGILLKKTFAPIARFFSKIRGARKFAGNVSQLLQETIRILRNLGEGNLIKWIRSQTSAVLGKLQVAKEKMFGLCETVVSALSKYIQNAGFFNPVKGLAEKMMNIFRKVRDSIDDFIQPFFRNVTQMVDDFIQRLANRFTGTAASSTDPQVFKLGRRNADNSGGLGKQGRSQDPPEGTCPVGMRRAMGSNPVNMITGQPFENATDFSAGLFKLERTWTPGQGGGLFGPMWSTPLSSFIKTEPDGAVFQTAMGRKIPFDLPFSGAVCVNVHATDYELVEYGKGYAIRDADNLTWIYEQHDGIVRRLSGLRDANGNGFDLYYAIDENAPLGMQPCQLTLTNGDIYDLQISKGRLESITHRASGVVEVQFEYNPRGLLIGATNASGFRLGYGYDKQWRLTVLSYNDEHKTRYFYDHANRVVGVKTDTPYYQDIFEYGELNADGMRTVTYTNAMGHQKVVCIDADDQVVAISEADGAFTYFTYNENGDIASEKSPLGLITKNTWDRFSRLLKTEYPDGTSEMYERDDRGRLLVYTNQAGAQWQYQRDARGNVVQETLPDGSQRHYTLNERGQVSAARAPDGTLSKYGYDERQQLSIVINGLGAETRLERDTRGRVRKRTEADGSETEFEYNAGNRITSATLADGRTLRWQWSTRGTLLASADGEGNVTRLHYGAYGLLQSVTNPMGGTIRFEHDSLMRISQVVNEAGDCYHYHYDNAGRVTQEIDFSGRKIQYGYDIGGRLIEKVAGNGTRSRYSYTGMNRLNRIEIFENGEEAPPAITRFTYDQAGRVIHAQNTHATVKLERDILGRVIKETLNDREVASFFDEAGRLSGQNFDGRSTTLNYNQQGLLDSLAIGNHDPLNFEHGLMGRERARRSGSGFVEHRSWDQLGQLKTQVAGRELSLLDPDALGFSEASVPSTTSGGVGAARTYEYDQAFNPVAINDARWGSTRYQHNPNGQITQADYSKNGQTIAQERFEYDATRNILESLDIARIGSEKTGSTPNVTQHQEAYKRSAGGRIERRGDTTYAYDEQGRLISKRVDKKGFRPKTWHYGWDGQDQLSTVTTPDKSQWQYQYDPFGRRVRKRCVQQGGSTKRSMQGVDYLWSGNLLSEEKRMYADGTEQTVAYHYEQNSFRPIAQEVNGELHYIVTDHIGTPKELLSEEGELLWSAKQKLWGKIDDTWKLRAANDDETEKPECLLRFQGQIEDKESGLYYNRFRYYEPGSAGYVSSDPIGLAGGSNNYAYVPSPTFLIDPFGLSCGRGSGTRSITSQEEFNQRYPESYFNDPHAKHTPAEQQQAAWEVYQDTNQGDREIVMGRLKDTEAGAELGMQRLSTDVWSPQVNDAWVQGGIDANKPFYLGSPTTVSNLRTQPYPHHPDWPMTVTHRELTQLRAAGYTRQGDYLVPPGGN